MELSSLSMSVAAVCLAAWLMIRSGLQKRRLEWRFRGSAVSGAGTSNVTAAAVATATRSGCSSRTPRSTAGREVAEVIATTMRSLGSTWTCVQPKRSRTSTRRHRRVGQRQYTWVACTDQARNLLGAHRDELAGRRLAVLALGPRTLADDDVESTRARLREGPRESLGGSGSDGGIFGGVVDPTKLGFSSTGWMRPMPGTGMKSQLGHVRCGARVRGREWV